MTRRIVVVPPELSLDAAWETMTRNRFRHLPVVSAGALIGIVSDRDVLARATLLGDGSLHVPRVAVGEAMTPAPFVCNPDTSVSSIVRTMTEEKLDTMPVVSASGKLVGLVTTTDLLLLLIELDEAKTPLPFQWNLEEHGFAVSA